MKPEFYFYISNSTWILKLWKISNISFYGHYIKLKKQYFKVLIQELRCNLRIGKLFQFNNFSMMSLSWNCYRKYLKHFCGTMVYHWIIREFLLFTWSAPNSLDIVNAHSKTKKNFYGGLIEYMHNTFTVEKSLTFNLINFDFETKIKQLFEDIKNYKLYYIMFLSGRFHLDLDYGSTKSQGGKFIYPARSIITIEKLIIFVLWFNSNPIITEHQLVMLNTRLYTYGHYRQLHLIKNIEFIGDKNMLIPFLIK